MDVETTTTWERNTLGPPYAKIAVKVTGDKHEWLFRATSRDCDADPKLASRQRHYAPSKLPGYNEARKAARKATKAALAEVRKVSLHDRLRAIRAAEVEDLRRHVAEAFTDEEPWFAVGKTKAIAERLERVDAIIAALKWPEES